jgi:hypothetical protein
MRNTLAI